MKRSANATDFTFHDFDALASLNSGKRSQLQSVLTPLLPKSISAVSFIAQLQKIVAEKTREAEQKQREAERKRKEEEARRQQAERELQEQEEEEAEQAAKRKADEEQKKQEEEKAKQAAKLKADEEQKRKKEESKQKQVEQKRKEDEANKKEAEAKITILKRPAVLVPPPPPARSTAEISRVLYGAHPTVPPVMPMIAHAQRNLYELHVGEQVLANEILRMQAQRNSDEARRNRELAQIHLQHQRELEELRKKQEQQAKEHASEVAKLRIATERATDKQRELKTIITHTEKRQADLKRTVVNLVTQARNSSYQQAPAAVTTFASTYVTPPMAYAAQYPYQMSMPFNPAYAAQYPYGMYPIPTNFEPYGYAMPDSNAMFSMYPAASTYYPPDSSSTEEASSAAAPESSGSESAIAPGNPTGTDSASPATPAMAKKS